MAIVIGRYTAENISKLVISKPSDIIFPSTFLRSCTQDTFKSEVYTQFGNNLNSENINDYTFQTRATNGTFIYRTDNTLPIFETKNIPIPKKAKIYGYIHNNINEGWTFLKITTESKGTTNLIHFGSVGTASGFYTNNGSNIIYEFNESTLKMGAIGREMSIDLVNATDCVSPSDTTCTISLFGYSSSTVSSINFAYLYSLELYF